MLVVLHTKLKGFVRSQKIDNPGSETIVLILSGSNQLIFLHTVNKSFFSIP